MQLNPEHLTFRINLSGASSGKQPESEQARAISAAASSTQPAATVASDGVDIQMLRVINTDPTRYLAFALRARYVDLFNVRPPKGCIAPGSSLTITISPFEKPLAEYIARAAAKVAASSSQTTPAATEGSVRSSASQAMAPARGGSVAVKPVDAAAGASSATASHHQGPPTLSDTFRLDSVLIDADVASKDNDALLASAGVPPAEVAAYRSHLSTLFAVAAGTSSVKGVEGLLRKLLPSAGAPHVVHNVATFAVVDAAQSSSSAPSRQSSRHDAAAAEPQGGPESSPPPPGGAPSKAGSVASGATADSTSLDAAAAESLRQSLRSLREQAARLQQEDVAVTKETVAAEEAVAQLENEVAAERRRLQAAQAVSKKKASTDIIFSEYNAYATLPLWFVAVIWLMVCIAF